MYPTTWVIQNEHNVFYFIHYFPRLKTSELSMYHSFIEIEMQKAYQILFSDFLLQYMKALKATLTTSQPVISPDDFSTVFYRITELHAAHSDFLNGLKEKTTNWDGTSSIGELFRVLVGYEIQFSHLLPFSLNYLFIRQDCTLCIVQYKKCVTVLLRYE